LGERGNGKKLTSFENERLRKFRARPVPRVKTNAEGKMRHHDRRAPETKEVHQEIAEGSSYRDRESHGKAESVLRGHGGQRGFIGALMEGSTIKGGRERKKPAIRS